METPSQQQPVLEKRTPSELPTLPEVTRNQDTLQWFYKLVTDNFTCANGRTSPLYLRSSTHGLAVRIHDRWQVYSKNSQTQFWRDVQQAYPTLFDLNWSIRRTQDLWAYFQIYAPDITFDNRRYFEASNAILDGYTGELVTTPDRHITHPTTRHSPLAYDPTIAPTSAWTEWYTTMDEHQRHVRDWSVGSAILGDYGLLFTFGNTRTGKSTLAEGLAQVLGDGARAIELSRQWGRFYTKHFENTTYLFDSDAKGSKGQNNDNYGTLHLMASGDPVQVEVKGGELYQTTNYGFMEVISNSPTTMTFEPSLVDRVRFCLYNYVSPKSDGGVMKRKILADKQAWLNYAVSCAIKLAHGETERPPIDDYQAYGWYLWLREANSYSKMCIDEGRTVTYKEYAYSYQGAMKFMMTKETVEDVQSGIGEINRQYGSNFLSKDWKKYGESLKGGYNEARKLF